MRVGILDIDVDNIACSKPGRHIAQIYRAVDLGRIGLAANGTAVSVNFLRGWQMSLSMFPV